MKPMLIVILIFISKVALSVPMDDFVITIQTSNTDNGSSSATEFTIPTLGIGYDYNVDCNDDGTLEATGLSGDYTCDYNNLGGAGLHTLRIQDNTGVLTGFPRIAFRDMGDRLKILTVQQWGKGKWKSMASAFQGAANLTITAADKPDLSETLVLNSMFENALLARPDVGNWDVSTIVNMNAMFRGVSLPIANYDAILIGFIGQSLQDTVSFGGGNSIYCSADAITARANLFSIYNWTVTDGGECAPGAMTNHFVISVKTDNLGSSLDTQFTIPTSTFGETYNYNVDCNNDGTDEGIGVTGSYTCDYASLGGAGTYTIRIKPLTIDGFPRIYFNNTGDRLKIVALEQWGSVIWGSAMNKAFAGTFNMVVNATDTPQFSNVTNMNSMFFNAVNANPDTTNWDVSSVTNMSSMFKGASSATPNTSLWDTSAVTNMSFMFEGADIANPDTSDWNTSNVTSMSGMFQGASSATPDTSLWDTSQVANMNSLFNNAILVNPDTSQWDTSGVTSMSNMFSGATNANPDTSLWDTVAVTNMGFMFANAVSAKPNTSLWDTANVTNMGSMFSGATVAEPDTSLWNTSQVTNMSFMFTTALMAVPDTSNWDISNVTTMSNMFLETELPINDYEAILIGFSTQNVQSNVLFHGGVSTVCSNAAINAKDSLINNHGWQITDGGACTDRLFADGFELIF